MSDRDPDSEYEPVAIQPFAGLVVEVVRRWHEQGTALVAEHRYRARAGDQVVADDVSLAMLCDRLRGRYPRGADLDNLPQGDRRSRRYGWLE